MSEVTPSLRRRPALIALGVLTLLCGAILGTASELLAPRIAMARSELIWRDLQAVAPQPYDNDLLHDVLEATDAELLGTQAAVRVFRARHQGKPAGVAIEVVAPNGYNGAVRLLIGIRDDGELAGVRVLEQHETRGLGDGVDQRNSDWLLQFNGRSLSEAQPQRWTVRQDKGDFDALSGATITSRAVTQAIRRSLEYYRLHRDRLW